jgi:hypothetical protein
MDDGGHPAEQGLLVDLADGEAVVPVVDRSQAGPAAGGDGGVAPCTSARTGSPAGTSDTPTSASRSAQSGGAHTRTSAPSSRSRTASPASGSTPPRESYVDNNTRTC